MASFAEKYKVNLVMSISYDTYEWLLFHIDKRERIIVLDMFICHSIEDRKSFDFTYNSLEPKVRRKVYVTYHGSTSARRQSIFESSRVRSI